MSCASSGHITKLQQSIFEPFDIYGKKFYEAKLRYIYKNSNKLFAITITAPCQFHKDITIF
jgi:hypothetical protein